MESFYKEHNDYKNALMLELQKKYKLAIIIWNQPTGVFFSKAGTPYKIGQPGQSDLYGGYTIRIKDDDYSLLFNIEVKTRGGKLTKKQKLNRELSLKKGIAYFVAHKERHSIFLKEFDNWIQKIENL